MNSLRHLPGLRRHRAGASRHPDAPADPRPRSADALLPPHAAELPHADSEAIRTAQGHSLVVGAGLEAEPAVRIDAGGPIPHRGPGAARGHIQGPALGLVLSRPTLARLGACRGREAGPEHGADPAPVRLRGPPRGLGVRHGAGPEAALAPRKCFVSVVLRHVFL